MMKRWAVVITGASTGIGKACALHLDAKGFKVFAGVRKEADADALRAEATTNLTPLRLDVTKPEMIASAVETVQETLGGSGLMGLVNNAGVAVTAPLEFVPLDELRWQLEVNLIGQVAVTQAFLPLIRQAQGRIINMSSISGRVALPFVGPYAISKFGLEAFTDSLRLEVKPWGIEVISVQPGSIATPIWEKAIDTADTVWDGVPAEGKELYEDGFQALRNSAIETGNQGIPPEHVAEVVLTALTETRPSTRYLVGNDAKAGAVLSNILPDRLRDWVIRVGGPMRSE